MAKNRLCVIQEDKKIFFDVPAEIVCKKIGSTQLELIGSNVYIVLYADGKIEIGTQEFNTSKFDKIIEELENVSN